MGSVQIGHQNYISKPNQRGHWDSNKGALLQTQSVNFMAHVPPLHELALIITRLMEMSHWTLEVFRVTAFIMTPLFLHWEQGFCMVI